MLIRQITVLRARINAAQLEVARSRARQTIANHHISATPGPNCLLLC